MADNFELLLLNLWISDLIFEHLTIKKLTRKSHFKIMLQLLRMQTADNFNYIIVWRFSRYPVLWVRVHQSKAMWEKPAVPFLCFSFTSAVTTATAV